MKRDADFILARTAPLDVQRLDLIAASPITDGFGGKFQTVLTLDEFRDNMFGEQIRQNVDGIFDGCFHGCLQLKLSHPIAGNCSI